MVEADKAIKSLWKPGGDHVNSLMMIVDFIKHLDTVD